MSLSCIVLSFLLAAGAGPVPPGAGGDLPPVLALELQPRIPAPHPVPWTPGRKAVTDWAAIIDATWYPVHSPAEQFQAFGAFWNDIDRRFACFHHIDDVWQEQWDRYLYEVGPGVSRGRFAAILGHMSLTLRESHTQAYDADVRATYAGRGIPLLYVNGLGGRAGSLGAAVTARDDGTGLVYRVQPDNPLGLAPGDVILGYDGRSWADCLDELLAAELPLLGTWGSSPSSWSHGWTAAVGANWHLFDTMDVVQHATGDTLHLPTAPADAYHQALFASGQLDVGIPFPDIYAEETVTYGVIERGGGQIGYVYVFGWAYDAGVDFHAALDDLTSNYETSGLIIDFRYNYGGNMFLSDEALGLLFAEATPTIEWFESCSEFEHLPLCSLNIWPYYTIDPAPVDRFYDRPIAVLTGPGAVSSGDQVALRMTYHPTARVFGRSTAAAFNSPEFLQAGPDIHFRNATAECARVDAPDVPLTHLDFPVDVPVWLTPDDVALGIDTVVETAVAWILDTTVRVEDGTDPDGGPAETPPAAAGIVGARPNPFNPLTELVIALTGPTRGALGVYDLAGRRVRSFPLRGLGAGEHVVAWDGKDAAGRSLPTGAYVVRLETETRVHATKVTLLR